MTDRQLEIARTFTDKEVMSNAIAKLRTLTLNKLLTVEDPQERANLIEQQATLEYEEMAVLGDDEVSKNIQDKVVKLYSPILKAYYEEK
ncbi:MAG: hypothetical protein PUJ69_01880 [Porphyromonas somerae]|uniref:hypothetical protein n=1 Tax=Porphyromonas somerae TaxID=322095 RepID=UPI0026EDE422|nr:hypothetical protein [Porphyromonas somerae]MDD7557404.1 hypothetical protein [Porphyromonas somerae]MDY3884168.1 hypothetical protein [Porphyromonas somerae]MDY5815265.1 hypothetical protein [Porphyromonas somerae]